MSSQDPTAVWTAKAQLKQRNILPPELDTAIWHSAVTKGIYFATGDDKRSGLPNANRRRGRDLLQLGQVIQIMAGHGFDDYSKGHRTSLRMSDRTVPVLWRSLVQQNSVPLAQSHKRAQSIFPAYERILRRPAGLIEGLDDMAIFSQCLPQAEREGNLGIGEVAKYLARCPFPRCEAAAHSGRPQSGDHIA